MPTSLFQIAAKISTPLALAGIIVVVLYLLYRLFLKSAFLSKISPQSSFKLLNRFITYIFILALAATFLGILGHYVVKIFQPKMGRSDIIDKMDERRNSLSSILKFRADTAVTTMDTVIKRLESVGPSEIKQNISTSMPHFSNANETINRLKKLKSEFITLNNRHLVAIQKGDIQLSHEIIMINDF